jgi:hypothetical protein
MMKGGLPPFKKYNKEIIKINKDKSFEPNILITSLLKKNTDKLFKKNISNDNKDNDDNDDNDE